MQSPSRSRVPSEGGSFVPTRLTHHSDATLHPEPYTQVSLPALDAEPPINDAEDARFDVRREAQVLAAEGMKREGSAASLEENHDMSHTTGRAGESGDASSRRGRSGGDASSVGGAPLDPLSLDATVRRMVEASEDPVVDKYVRMGYKRDAVIYGLAMMGDKESRVVDFMVGFEKARDLGFTADVIAGALASHDNDVEAAISSCLR